MLLSLPMLAAALAHACPRPLSTLAVAYESEARRMRCELRARGVGSEGSLPHILAHGMHTMPAAGEPPRMRG
jgi:hypothetical protein